MSAETMKKTKKPFSMKKWVKSRNGQQTIVILSFMIIPLLLLFVFTYLPFGEMVKFSFYKMKYATPVDKRQFVGFRNYIDVFKKDECFSALKLSLYYMAGAMVQLVLALYLATILSFKTKFGNMFKGFMFFPYLISGIAIGFIFKFFYRGCANFTQGEGQTYMENLLSKGTVKDIDVIISENDNMIFGAMKALDRNGKSYGPEGDIIMISFDALHESFENMMAGKLHATVECNPLLASTVETVIEELEAGREVDKIYNTEENIYTYENAADYIDQRKY